MLENLLAFLFTFLSCIPCKGDELLTVAEASGEELVEFFTLAVGQSIHWIDDDGFDA